MSFPTPSTFDRHRRGLSRRRGVRLGLSIVEVLTSIVVAMIGVFGVMILIPFAVRQAQTGLDSDAAVTTARNAISQMELTGMQFPQNWGGHNPAIPQVLSLDPLGVTEPSGGGGATFPFRLEGNVGGLTIPAVNFLDPAGNQFNSEMARRMCRTANDLLFEEPDVANFTSGPPQIFDVDGGGNLLRRQAQGRVSWSAIVVPFKSVAGGTPPTSRWSYRMYILVYKNRRFDDAVRVGGAGSALARNPDGTITDLGGVMVAGQIDPDANTGAQSPLGNVVGVPPLVTEVAQRDDWVLLINRSRNWDDDTLPNPQTTPPTVFVEKGFDRQLAFYRVVNVNSAGNSVTLDGPDFDFGTPHAVAGDNSDDDLPESVIRETHIVHLKDVVGVYERTFTPEQESNWNLSN